MKLTTRELVLFALLSAVMYLSKIVMEVLPNIHLLATLTITYMVVYRKKALLPLFVFIFLTGLLNGFGLWWIPYLYLWPLLWGAAMLLPRQMKPALAIPVYMGLAALHGFLYGTLYAPFQALVYGLSWDGMIAWILAGLPWDLTHGIGNCLAALLIWPLCTLLQKGQRYFPA